MSESSEHNHGNSQGKLGYDPFPRELIDAGQMARLVGFIGLGLLLIGSFFEPGHSFRSLLLAFHLRRTPRRGPRLQASPALAPEGLHPAHQ